MTKTLTALALLLVSAGTAFGATAEFVFFNKLGLLIVLNVILGGLLTLAVAVIASELWGKVKQNRLRLVRVRARPADKFHQPNPGSRTGTATQDRKVSNG